MEELAFYTDSMRNEVSQILYVRAHDSDDGAKESTSPSGVSGRRIDQYGLPRHALAKRRHNEQGG